MPPLPQKLAGPPLGVRQYTSKSRDAAAVGFSNWFATQSHARNLRCAGKTEVSFLKYASSHSVKVRNLGTHSPFIFPNRPCGLLVVKASIGIRLGWMSATGVAMSRSWRFASRLLRRVPCWVIVVLCCFVGTVRYANASCGDHLAMPARHSFESFQIGWRSMPQQMPNRSNPCHGPECGGAPFAPIPVDVPAVSFAYRQVFVPSKVPVIDVAVIVELQMPNCSLSAQTGHAPRLERPPERG